jgi:hypothetical protein
LFEKSEKDGLTPEEADEFLELARKVVREYWDRREAYRLHIYAAIVRGLTYKKYYEKKETKEEKHQGCFGLHNYLQHLFSLMFKT